MKGLIEGHMDWKAKGGETGGFAGTSNVSFASNRSWPSASIRLRVHMSLRLTPLQVYFAIKYGLKPMGTIAHEWIMAIGAIHGYKGSNGRAMDMWEEGRVSL